jgi:hypothetical protein
MAVNCGVRRRRLEHQGKRETTGGIGGLRASACVSDERVLLYFVRLPLRPQAGAPQAQLWSVGSKSPSRAAQLDDWRRSLVQACQPLQTSSRPPSPAQVETIVQLVVGTLQLISAWIDVLPCGSP